MEKSHGGKAPVILAFLLGAILTLGGVGLTLYCLLGTDGLAVLEGWVVVRTGFIGEYDEADAADGALSGLVDSLGDRWSYYLDETAYTSQSQRRTNSYVGIGVTVGYGDERGLQILTVRPGGPAEEAGLAAGEIITAVDGTALEGEGRYDGPDLIMGEAGTSLQLTLLTEEGEERQVSLLRGEVETDPVSYEMLAGNIGYVKLENFYDHSAERLNGAVDELVEQGAAALVFDMRNNGGGYVRELTAMLDHLLPEGPVFRMIHRDGSEDVTESDAGCVELPMAVLVNANTYSAAELFAAQLQESVGAVIVGESTSGKGYSQQALKLVNGGALNISTNRYTTGGGVSLVGTGVTLDCELALTEEEAGALYEGTLDHGADRQLQKALELLK